MIKYILLSISFTFLCMMLFLTLELPLVLTHLATFLYFTCLILPFATLGYIVIYESYKEFIPVSVKNFVKKYFFIFLIGFIGCLIIRHLFEELNTKSSNFISYLGYFVGSLFVFGINSSVVFVEK